MFRPCGLRQSRKISGAISVSCFIRRELIWQQKKEASKTTAKTTVQTPVKTAEEVTFSTDSKESLFANEKATEKKKEVKPSKSRGD